MRAVTAGIAGPSAIVEDGQVELTEAGGVGNRIDFDDLEGQVAGRVATAPARTLQLVIHQPSAPAMPASITPLD